MDARRAGRAQPVHLRLRRVGRQHRGADPHSQQCRRQFRRRAGEADGVLPRRRAQLEPGQPRKCRQPAGSAQLMLDEASRSRTAVRPAGPAGVPQVRLPAGDRRDGAERHHDPALHRQRGDGVEDGADPPQRPARRLGGDQDDLGVHDAAQGDAGDGGTGASGSLKYGHQPDRDMTAPHRRDLEIDEFSKHTRDLARRLCAIALVPTYARQLVDLRRKSCAVAVRAARLWRSPAETRLSLATRADRPVPCPRPPIVTHR